MKFLFAALLLIAISGCSSVAERAHELPTNPIGHAGFTEAPPYDGVLVYFGERDELRRVMLVVSRAQALENEPLELDARLVTWSGNDIAPEGRGRLIFQEDDRHTRLYSLELAFESDVPRSELCSVAVLLNGKRLEVAIPEKKTGDDQ